MTGPDVVTRLTIVARPGPDWIDRTLKLAAVLADDEVGRLRHGHAAEVIVPLEVFANTTRGPARAIQALEERLTATGLEVDVDVDHRTELATFTLKQPT